MRVGRSSIRSRRLACVSRLGRRLVTALAGLSLVALPRLADACSYATVVIESSYPESGADGVPTNAMLFVSGPLYGPGVSLDRADGTPVAIEVLALDPSGFDVKPLAELEPNQAYVLRAPGPTELGHNPYFVTSTVLEFTTGDGPAAAPSELLAPELGNVMQLFPAIAAPCGGYQLCTDAEVPAGTTLEVRIEEEVLQVAAPGPWWRTYGDGIGDGCLTVSVRDFTGNRSPPTRVCTDAIVTYAASAEQFLACENDPDLLARSAAEPVEVIPAQAAGGGCTLRPTPRHEPTRVWTLSSVLAAWISLSARRTRRTN